MVTRTLLSVVAGLSVCFAVSAQTEQEAWQYVQDVITKPLMAERTVANKAGIVLEKASLPLNILLGLAIAAFYMERNGVSDKKAKEHEDNELVLSVAPLKHSKDIGIFLLIATFLPVLTHKCTTALTSYLQTQPQASNKILTDIMVTWSEHRQKMPASIRQDIDAIIQQDDILTDAQAWALVKKYREAAKVLAFA